LRLVQTKSSIFLDRSIITEIFSNHISGLCSQSPWIYRFIATGITIAAWIKPTSYKDDARIISKTESSFPHLCIISSKKCQKVKIFIDGKVDNVV